MRLYVTHYNWSVASVFLIRSRQFYISHVITSFSLCTTACTQFLPKHTNTKICFVMFLQNISLATKTYKNTNTKICFVMFLQNTSLATKTYKNTNTKICFVMFLQNISPATETYEHTTHCKRQEYYLPFTHNLSYFLLPHQTVDVDIPAHFNVNTYGPCNKWCRLNHLPIMLDSFQQKYIM